jgi:hypothetical protein
MITESELLKILSDYEKLEAEIRRIALIMAEIRGIVSHRNNTSYTGFDIENGVDGKPVIVANFEEYYSGDTDYDHFKIPLHYFWTEDVKAAATVAYAAERAEETRLAKLAEEEKKRKNAVDQEASERAVLARLKKKYEGA